MGLFDWLGPLGFGGRRGWSELPAARADSRSSEQKLYSIDDHRAVLTVPTLVHGPGTSDILRGWRGNDSNSAVYACLDKLTTAIAEPELKVYRLEDGERVENPEASVLSVLRRPNPHMTLDTLLAYLIWCLQVDGNAYWRKLRSGNETTGNVVELWPISPTRLELKRDNPTDFISSYRYWHTPSRYEDIPPENVVHFRHGLDDQDHRLGCSGLKRLAREVSSDDQATHYADRLLHNFAVPGLSVEFPSDADSLSQAQIDEIKARLQAAYGGDNVGAVSVMSPGGRLVSHGFSPEQMQLDVLHRVPEERIAAVLGVPAIVAGLGAGLDRSTYANFKEAREAFTEMTLIPSWKAIAATITLSLLPDFSSDSAELVDFDIAEVRALADDENAKAVRLKTYVDAGILDVNEARAEIGREPRALVPASDPADAEAPGGEPPATRSRPRILTLPRSTKALDDLPGQYDKLKDDKLPDWEREMQTFLKQQHQRVDLALHAGGDTAYDLVPESEATLLGETLTPLQAKVLDDVARLVVAEFGIEFQLDDPATRAYLTEAGQNVVGITDTTREAVRAALIEGQQAGEGIDQLARRLRELPAFNDARARTVARTELAHSTTTAALANYRASGVVVGVRVFDGDYDGACAAMNGRTFPMNQLPPTLQHPNCRRAFAPIVDASEMEKSA